MQITLQPEIQRRPRRGATDLGISLAEYVRRLVARDLAAPEKTNDPACIFDLGGSSGSDIARNKFSMLAEAFDANAPVPGRSIPAAQTPDRA